MAKKKTTEIFIKESRAIHGDRYDYSKAEYDGKDTKVVIICPKHGEFRQTPHNHIHCKQGCPKCKYERLSQIEKSNIEDVIKKAKEKHNNKYDYSKVDYKNTNTKVIITCPIHGDFEQTMHSHLFGHGCPKCSSNYRKNTEDFVTKANEIHNHKFDYSKTNYVSATKKVCIICPKHGEFYQIPNDHLDGHGCPKCNQSILEKQIMQMLDENKIEYVYQKRFHWLRNKLPMSLDFFIPKYNIAIECQGEQHFENKEFTNNSLNQIIKRDSLKNQLCKEHDIKILYFSKPKYIGKHMFGDIYCNNNELLEEIKKYGT